MTYQTDEKHLNNMSKYFVGVVNIAFNCYNNQFLLSIILAKRSVTKTKSVTVKKLLKCNILRVFVPHWRAPHLRQAKSFEVVFLCKVEKNSGCVPD